MLPSEVSLRSDQEMVCPYTRKGSGRNDGGNEYLEIPGLTGPHLFRLVGQRYASHYMG